MEMMAVVAIGKTVILHASPSSWFEEAEASDGNSARDAQGGELVRAKVQRVTFGVLPTVLQRDWKVGGQIVAFQHIGLMHRSACERRADVQRGIGLAAGIMARLGFMKSFPKALITACVAGFVAVLISTPLNVIFWGGTTGNVWGDMVFAATQAAGLSTLLGSFLDEIVVDVPDKIITLIVVYFVLKGLPRKLTALYDANAKIEHLE